MIEYTYAKIPSGRTSKRPQKSPCTQWPWATKNKSSIPFGLSSNKNGVQKGDGESQAEATNGLGLLDEEKKFISRKNSSSKYPWSHQHESHLLDYAGFPGSDADDSDCDKDTSSESQADENDIRNDGENIIGQVKKEKIQPKIKLQPKSIYQEDFIFKENCQGKEMPTFGISSQMAGKQSLSGTNIRAGSGSGSSRTTGTGTGTGRRLCGDGIGIGIRSTGTTDILNTNVCNKAPDQQKRWTEKTLENHDRDFEARVKRERQRMLVKKEREDLEFQSIATLNLDDAISKLKREGHGQQGYSNYY